MNCGSWVKVKPQSRRNEVVKNDDGSYLVSTTATPERGKANEMVITLLAAHTGKPKSHIRIVRGHTSRIKTVEIK